MQPDSVSVGPLLPLTGFSETMAASSLADLTMTGTSTLSRAEIAAAMSAECFAAVPLAARKTALPLLSKVATPVYPRPESRARSSAMGTRLALPTLTPRSRATNVGICDA